MSRIDDSDDRRRLATLFLDGGDVARALVLLEALALERPDVESASVDLAVALLASGRTDAARVVLERTTSGGRGSMRAWVCLGVAYERLGRAVAADAAFARGNCLTERARARARSLAAKLTEEHG